MTALFLHFFTIGYSSVQPVLTDQTPPIVYAEMGELLHMQCTFVNYNGFYHTYWDDNSGYRLDHIKESPFCVSEVSDTVESEDRVIFHLPIPFVHISLRYHFVS